MIVHTQCAVGASDGPRRVTRETKFISRFMRNLLTAGNRHKTRQKSSKLDKNQNLFPFPTLARVGGAQYASDKYGTSGGELLIMSRPHVKFSTFQVPRNQNQNRYLWLSCSIELRLGARLTLERALNPFKFDLAAELSAGRAACQRLRFDDQNGFNNGWK